MANTIGTSYVRVMPEMSQFGTSVAKGLSSSMSSASAGAEAEGKKAASQYAAGFGAITGLTAAIMSKAFTIISNSLSAAISRVDILNNFPKQMQNLGFSAEEASNSINMLKDGIQGLPTTLPSVATYTQQLSAVTGDLSGATATILAMNDALLAGGKPAADQAAAMEMFIKIISTGRPDMERWQALQAAMPGQLNMIAQALGAVSTDQLRQELMSGNISMQEFMDAIVKLDSEGINGLTSFADQAKDATGGIQTTLTNAKTAVVNLLAEFISLADSVGLFTAFDQVKNIFSALSGVLKDVNDWVASLIGDNSSGLQGVNETVKPLEPVIRALTTAFIALVGVMTVVRGVSMAVAAVNTILSLSFGGLTLKSIALFAAQQLVAFGNFLIQSSMWILLVVLLVIIVAIFMVAKNWDRVSQAIQRVINWFKNLGNIISGFVTDAISSIGDFCRGLVDGISHAVQDAINWIKELPSNIMSIFADAGNWLVDTGKDMIEGLWQGILDAKDWLLGLIGGFVDDIIGGIKGFFGIGSPARTMFPVGRDIDRGLAVGIMGNTAEITKAMESVNSAIQSSLINPFDLSDDLTADIKTPVNISRISTASIDSKNLIPEKITLIDSDGSILANTKAIISDRITRNNINKKLIKGTP